MTIFSLSIAFDISNDSYHSNNGRFNNGDNHEWTNHKISNVYVESIIDGSVDNNKYDHKVIIMMNTLLIIIHV